MQGVPGITWQQEVLGGQSVYWMPTILLAKEYGRSRGELAQQLKQANIDSRPVFTPMHELLPYRQEKEFPISHQVAAAGLSLPSGVLLTSVDVKLVIAEIQRSHV